MVVVDGIKYACERCIRGHRVSGCNHVDKPLTMIKKKGRPATHCNHCRKNKLGKPRGPATLCSCSDSRRDRTVIIPKDLRALQLEHGVKVELTDGTIMSPLDADYGTDHSTTASAATTIDSSPAPSPLLPSKLYAATGSGPVNTVGLSGSRHHDGFSPYDPISSSASYSQANTTGLPRETPVHGEGPSSSAPYGSHDEYSNVPAFQYEAGFLGQPYNADLYNSASGNNMAAAEANAGGESTAAIARLNRGINGQLMGMLSDDAKGQASLGGASQLLSAMPRHPLLATSSRDVEASMNALGPLSVGPRPRDIEREKLVGGILRSNAQTRPEPDTGNPKPKPDPDGGENDEDYSSVHTMPELSSLY